MKQRKNIAQIKEKERERERGKTKESNRLRNLLCSQVKKLMEPVREIFAAFFFASIGKDSPLFCFLF